MIVPDFLTRYYPKGEYPFTYPDNMYELEYDEYGNLIGGKNCIEAQVCLLSEIWKNSRKNT